MIVDHKNTIYVQFQQGNQLMRIMIKITKRESKSVRVRFELEISEPVAKAISQGMKARIIAIMKVLLLFLLTSYIPLPDKLDQPSDTAIQPSVEELDQEQSE